MPKSCGKSYTLRKDDIINTLLSPSAHDWLKFAIFHLFVEEPLCHETAKFGESGALMLQKKLFPHADWIQNFLHHGETNLISDILRETNRTPCV